MKHYHLNALFCGLFLLVSCSKQSSKNESVPPDSAQLNQKKTLSTTYTNSLYDISLQKPGDWLLLEEPKLKAGDFALNLFPKDTKAALHTPLDVHANPKFSYIAIWPHGLGTELPKSQYAAWGEAAHKPNLQFEVNKENAKILKLKDGTAWAYFIVPQNPPKSWSSNGFLFAQIRTRNPSSHCYDKQTNKEIPPEKCNLHKGARFVREGTTDKNQARKVSRILSSISLKKVPKKTSAGDLIDIKKPLPNNDINSPLTIKGKAKGTWYFEGVFNVELMDAYGHTLAEKQVKANGDWTSDKFVPFSVTLSFDAPDDQRGRLVFPGTNPSGKPENAMRYTLPVIFPPR